MRFRAFPPHRLPGPKLESQKVERDDREVAASVRILAVDDLRLLGMQRSAPDCRPRRVLLHLSYSCVSPYGPAILVTHGQIRKWKEGRARWWLMFAHPATGLFGRSTERTPSPPRSPDRSAPCATPACECRFSPDHPRSKRTRPWGRARAERGLTPPLAVLAVAMSIPLLQRNKS